MKTVTRAVGMRRLLKLAAFLRALPRKRFNYNHWVGEDWQKDPALSCGTSACALGWATTMPLFRRAGLYLSKRYNTPCLVGRHPQFCSKYGYLAARLFGITEPEFDRIFVPVVCNEEDATPKYVARKIERFVAKKRAEAA